MTSQAPIDGAKSALNKVAPIFGAAPTPYAPLLSALPTVLPFVARQIKRYPVQSAVAAIGLAFFFAKRRSRQTGSDRYQIPY